MIGQKKVLYINENIISRNPRALQAQISKMKEKSKNVKKKERRD